MIIIIEGPDGAGKSTLADRIQQQTKYTQVHFGYPTTEEEKTKMFQMYIEALNANRNAIFDRAWYSEMVYGPIMRDKSYISYPQMYELEKRVAKGGGLLIHCTDNAGKLWARCQERGERYIKDFKSFSEIHKGFVDLMAAVPHKIPVLEYIVLDV